MPIIRADTKLIFFAHVPKCGGSAVQDYLHDRFGILAFEDRQYLSVPDRLRWTRTSPQHIDAASRDRLFPPGFFDFTFAIVRHPVARVISAYHFQLEVEQTISRNISFGDWMFSVAEEMEERPFAYDNHLRAMDDIVPADARIFYLEHGLDALVPWFDQVTGTKAGPRAVRPSNKRGDLSKVSSEKVRPTGTELALIEKMYSKDFERFGYQLGKPMPLAKPPVLSPEAIAERDMELARGKPLGKRIVRKLARLGRG